jgi:type IV secretory pathway TraG/TraD family ATPase VirD4
MNPKQNSSNALDLNRQILSLGKERALNLRDLFTGISVLGATGSGKSSGPGRTLALTFLKYGFGGLVLCAKSDEAETWRRYCKIADRLDDLIVFNPRYDVSFNWLDYEFRSGARGQGFVDNCVSLLMTVLEARDKKKRGGGENAYWDDVAKQTLSSVGDLLSAATGSLTIQSIYDVLISAPQSKVQAADEAWQDSSFCNKMVNLAVENNDKLSNGQRNDAIMAFKYLLGEWANHSDRTRSVVLSTITSMLWPFLRGPLAPLFSATTVTPDDTFQGKIIVIDLSVKEYQEAGIFAQLIWKTLFQRAVERRKVTNKSRPVFLFCDEAQYFATPNDLAFQATARSSMCATVYMSQSYSSYLSMMGENRAATDALLANLAIKVFCQNNDSVTNIWAADQIGYDWFSKLSTNINTGDSDGVSTGTTTERRYIYEPRQFQKLRNGSAENSYMVDAILFRSGAQVGNNVNGNHALVTFDQNEG